MKDVGKMRAAMELAKTDSLVPDDVRQAAQLFLKTELAVEPPVAGVRELSIEENIEFAHVVMNGLNGFTPDLVSDRLRKIFIDDFRKRLTQRNTEEASQQLRTP